MPSNRIGRVNEEIQRELSSLIRTVKDPRVADAGMVSVTAVETTPDLKYAKIYVSALNKDSSGQLLKGLKSAPGYLRREMGQRLNLRAGRLHRQGCPHPGSPAGPGRGEAPQPRQRAHRAGRGIVGEGLGPPGAQSAYRKGGRGKPRPYRGEYNVPNHSLYPSG